MDALQSLGGTYLSHGEIQEVNNPAPNLNSDGVYNKFCQLLVCLQQGVIAPERGTSDNVATIGRAPTHIAIALVKGRRRAPESIGISTAGVVGLVTEGVAGPSVGDSPPSGASAFRACNCLISQVCTRRQRLGHYTARCKTRVPTRL